MNAQRGWQTAIPFAVLFQEYMPLQISMYLLSGDILAATVFDRFCRIPRRFPFGKRPLSFLTFVVGKDVWQEDSGDVFKRVLRDAAVVDELLSSAQAAPPKKYFAAAFSHAAED